MINTLTSLMGKANSLQEQMDIGSREIEILREKNKRNVRDQKSCNRNEECLYGFINRVNTAGERISELGDILIETSKLQSRG